MMLFYRLVVAPTAVLILPFLAIFDRKIRRGLRLRMKTLPHAKFVTAPLWIHAASGEFEYAKAVIREVKRHSPEVPVVVTYFSPSYLEAIRKFDLVDHHEPLPLDLPGPCSSFIRRLKPRALLIARTDLWPELLSQTRRAAIPAIVFSYTQKPLTHVLRRWMTKWRLSLVDRIYCVSEMDKNELAKIGVQAEALGDTRYDQVALRLSQPKPLPERLKPSLPTLIVGSSWAQDEKVVIEAVQDLLKKRELQLILVPHEPTPEHVGDLQRLLVSMGLTSALYSDGKSWSDRNTLIVDKVGILAELYTWADIAVIGGSFRGSVHSVMEAIGAGLITIVGPYHLNNREAVDFQSIHVNGGEPIVKAVSDALELKSYVTPLLEKPEELAQKKSAIRSEFARKLGASVRLLNAIETVLRPSGSAELPRGGDESLHP
jgi:3-deoxy-D-manno-octulosonic-acid transferase